MTVFEVLPKARQCYILENWETCAARLIAEKQKLTKKQEKHLIEVLGSLNTMLDTAIAQEKEKKEEKRKKQERIKQELASVANYDSIRKMQQIRNAAKSIH